LALVGWLAGVCGSPGLPTGKPCVLALAVLARDLKICLAWTPVPTSRALVRHLPIWFGAVASPL